MRIGIVHPFGNLDSIPCLVSTITLLSRAGYQVDIFTRVEDWGHKPAVFDAPTITLLSADVPPRAARPLALRPWSDAQFRWMQLRRRHARDPYLCFIGVDPIGLGRAAGMARAVGVPLVYFSLELTLSYEIRSAAELAQKAREKELAQKAVFAIALGADRAELLERDNEMASGSVLWIPNAPLGGARHRRSRLLQERFGVAPGRRVILQSGELAPWAGTTELVASTRDWPEDWLLFCHSRRAIGEYYRQAYLDALKRIARPGSTVFSLDPFPRDAYVDLVCSADVGVAFYIPESGSSKLGDNARHMGRSSGKLAYYLQAGLPVLVNEISAHRQLVEAHGCGAFCASASLIAPALRSIFERYDEYSERSLRAFTAEFDVEGAFGVVLDRLSGLAHAGGLSPGRGEHSF